MDEWFYSFPAEIIVCNPDGEILAMNAIAIRQYENVGGADLIGQNIFDHHQEPSRRQVITLVERREKAIYTTEKDGMKKLVCISPWLSNGEYGGFTLMVLDLPKQLMNIVK